MYLLFISIKVWFSGQLSVRYYLFAMLFYMPSMALMTLTYNGFIDNTDVTRYAFILGSLIELFLFNSLTLRSKELKLHKSILCKKIT